ncbi:MAG: hypothetical protein AAFP90_06615 [Planctomycetota bacterium]
MISRVAFAAVLCLFLSSACHANNNYLIVGDAFFYFEIDRAEWKVIRQGELAIVDYDRPVEMPFTFCGYAGSKKLELSGLSDTFRRDFIDAVTKVKRNYASTVVKMKDDKPGFFGCPAGQY